MNKNKSAHTKEEAEKKNVNDNKSNRHIRTTSDEEWDGGKCVIFIWLIAHCFAGHIIYGVPFLLLSVPIHSGSIVLPFHVHATIEEFPSIL